MQQIVYHEKTFYVKFEFEGVSLFTILITSMLLVTLVLEVYSIGMHGQSIFF